MIFSFVYFLTSALYVWVYREMVLPPHTWITHAAVAFAWMSSVFVCFSTGLLLYKCRKQVNRRLLCDIQGSLPESRAICIGLSMLAVVLVLAEAGHTLTSMLSCLAWLCTCVFMWKMLVDPPQIVKCDDEFEVLKYQVVEAWDQHDFHRVSVILSQCDLREIEDITEEIERVFGPGDARMVVRLLD